MQKAHPDFYVANAGVSTDKAVDSVINGGIAKAGLIAVPLTLIVLLLVLGSAVAALVPLLLALTAAIATLGLIALPSHLVPMDPLVKEVILLIGLAVGVDYSLFYLRRERDERRAGRGPEAALEAAAATSGRAVLISGFTVMIAMAGLFFSGDKTFISFGVGTDARGLRGHDRLAHRAARGAVRPGRPHREGARALPAPLPPRHGRGWPHLGRRSCARRCATRWPRPSSPPGCSSPWPSPRCICTRRTTGVDALPKSMKELKTFHAVDDAFPGGASAAAVAIKAHDGPPLRAAIADLKRQALASGEMHTPIHVEQSPDRSVYAVDIPLAGNGTDKASDHALATLRNELLPATVGTVPGAIYAVSGNTAHSKDFTESMKSSVPLVFGFVMLFAFLLLLVAFRSLVIALKAIVLNLLSVGAAYGMLVAIFQWGWGENLLDFRRTGGIAAWLPVFLFVILFGLSMDYHVFILSRIREAYDRGLSTEASIEYGIRRTAGVVTGASVVMVGVFGVFALLPLLDLKEMGIGLALAILIDATIVRGVLLPSTMMLLGEANWYLPDWLRWLPHLEHGQPVVPVEAAGALAPSA